MRTQLLKWMIETAVPFLNLFRNPPQWPFTLNQQREMPVGSLGKDVAVFLDSRNLPLLPKYESHDHVHILLGYGTTPLEELKLQAFMVGNGSSSFAGKVLFVLGVLITPEYWPVLKTEIKRGQSADRIANYQLEKLANDPTETLRATLKIPAGRN